MDMDDFHDFITAVLTGIRTTFRTEFTSFWLPIQLGVILAIILIAYIARFLPFASRNVMRSSSQSRNVRASI